MAGYGAIRAGVKAVEAYREAGQAGRLGKAWSLRDLATGNRERTVPVAPAIFSIAQDAWKREAGMKEFNQLGWQTVRIVVNQAGLTAAGVGTHPTVEKARRWGRNASEGRAPWAGGPERATL